MNNTSIKTLTIISTIGAVLGILISVVGLAGVWIFRGKVNTSLNDSLEITDRTLDATYNMLGVVASSLAQAKDSLSSVETAARAVAETLDATESITDSIGAMAGEDLISVLADTQTALGSMQQSARLIDDTLAFISAIPIIGARYKPEVTLEESIGELSLSLEPVPGSLMEIQTEMDFATGNLETLRSEVEELAGSIGGIEQNLAQASAIVAEYQEIVTDIDGRVEDAMKTVRPVVTIATLFLSAFFLWMLCTQLTMIMQARQTSDANKELR